MGVGAENTIQLSYHKLNFTKLLYNFFNFVIYFPHGVDER